MNMDAQTADEWGLDKTDRMVRLWGEGWTYTQIANHFRVTHQYARLNIVSRLMKMEREMTLPKIKKWTQREFRQCRR